MPGSDRSDALRELGGMAAERREQANMTLDEVYDRTRIRMEYLRGIEAGNYEGFPEPVYVKGFIRTYLRLIGAEDLQEDFIAQLNRLQPKKEEPAANILGNASPGPRGFKPVSHVWLFLVLLAALAGTGIYVWYAWSNGGFKIENWRWPNFSQGTGSSGERTGVNTDVHVQASRDVAPETGPVSAEVASVETPAPRPKPSLMIRARGDVWMSVSIGDKNVYNRTLKSGAVVSWDLPAPARVRFGRPDMANVTLNGKDLGPANARGSKKAETYLYQPDGVWKKVN
ncbi:MAG: DUF4115 domain-containing protein [Fretibacterium sp.]|nr:DUF4115 domain-containing protein [Fretibacterium sp.]